MLYPSSPDSRKRFLALKELKSNRPPAPRNLALQPPKLDVKNLVETNKTSTSGTHVLNVDDRPVDTEVKPPTTKALITVHHTVYLLESKRNEHCILLAGLTVRREREGDRLIRWTDSTHTKGVWQDRASAWESEMYNEWIKRENEIYRKVDKEPACDRFTAFLAEYRHCDVDSDVSHVTHPEQTHELPKCVEPNVQSEANQHQEKSLESPTAAEIARSESPLDSPHDSKGVCGRARPLLTSANSEPYSVVAENIHRQDSIIGHHMQPVEIEQIGGGLSKYKSLFPLRIRVPFDVQEQCRVFGHRTIILIWASPVMRVWNALYRVILGNF
jgi:hypothetical protein